MLVPRIFNDSFTDRFFDDMLRFPFDTIKSDG